MNSLLTVIKAMLEILASQQAQISELQRNAELDNESDLTETDFAALTAQIETLNASVTADNESIPF
jgi:hypothetical protein